MKINIDSRVSESSDPDQYYSVELTGKDIELIRKLVTEHINKYHIVRRALHRSPTAFDKAEDSASVYYQIRDKLTQSARKIYVPSVRDK